MAPAGDRSCTPCFHLPGPFQYLFLTHSHVVRVPRQLQAKHPSGVDTSAKVLLRLPVGRAEAAALTGPSGIDGKLAEFEGIVFFAGLWAHVWLLLGNGSLDFNFGVEIKGFPLNHFLLRGQKQPSTGG